MKNNKTVSRALSLVLTFAILASFLVFSVPSASAATLRDTKVTYGENDELLWALKRLTGVATHMKANAHPDDENNATMASMLLRDGTRTVNLTLTTGTGGQNALGSEIDIAYGAVRNLELKQAMNTVRADQIHPTDSIAAEVARDFGFSKRWEETYLPGFWVWDVAIERITRIIREERPDIFFEQGSTARSQHGQHQATAMICYAAYLAAQDPNMFPDQIADGLMPWRIPFFTGSATGTSGDHARYPADLLGGYFAGKVMSRQPATTVRYRSGNYVESKFTGTVFYNGTTNPLQSSAQFGALSRQFHISQGVGGTPGAPGTTSNSDSSSSAIRLLPINGEEPPAAVDMFDPKWGVPKTLGDLAKTGNEGIDAAFTKLQADVDAIVAAFPDNAAVLALVHGMIKDVKDALALVAASNLAADVKYDLNYRLNRKLGELAKCSQQAARLAMKLNPATWTPYAGQALSLPVEITNNGTVAVNVTNVSLNVPKDWTFTGAPATGNLAPGAGSSSAFTVNIPTSAWYDYFQNTPVTATVTYEVGGVANAYTFAYNDKPNWDWEYNKLAVMPQFGLLMTPTNYAVNTLRDYSELPVKVDVTNNMNGAQTASVYLEAPAGWTVVPASINLSFEATGEVKTAEFKLIPAANFGGQDRVDINAKVVRDGVISSKVVQIVEYEHIGRTYYLYDSVLTIQGVDVVVPDGFKLGYVDGGRDLMYIYLAQIGFDVTLLTPEDIATGDLSKYDTIMTGTRAYGTRNDLNTNRARLLEYVNNGGNMVVNYQQASGDGWNAANAPYPINIGSPTGDWRIAEEYVPMTCLIPEHSVMHYPNKIVESDWDNWIQERSIYDVNFRTSSQVYQYVFEGIDTDEEINNPSRGVERVLAVTPYGKGHYTYNTFCIYRQIQGLVPGGYRLLTNIICQNYSEAPTVTDVSIMPASIVETFAANIPVVAEGKNLAGKQLSAYMIDAAGNQVGNKLALSNGKGTLKIAAAPEAGDYKVVVEVDGGIPKAAPIAVVPYDIDIWKMSYALNDDGFLVISFKADIADKPGVTVVKEDANVLGYAIVDKSIVTTFKPSTITTHSTHAISVSGIKYPDLFPSYSFTFAGSYTYVA